MNKFLSGGQEHGTFIGCPSAPLTAPSQSPVPVGFTFASCPNCGVRASIWSKERPSAPELASCLRRCLRACCNGAAEARADRDARERTVLNFMMEMKGSFSTLKLRVRWVECAKTMNESCREACLLENNEGVEYAQRRVCTAGKPKNKE